MLTVGQAAPEFRLPSAQGAEVSLAEYRGRRNVIVWFTKGMACVFCRQHMSQLAQSTPELAKRQAEVLQVTPSPTARGRFYAAKYRLPFPYLCDADDAVRHQWGIGVRRHGPLWYAGLMAKMKAVPPPENDFGQGGPALSEMGKVMRDDDMGFYIVDRAGVIRYAYGGSYLTLEDAGSPTRPLPGTVEVLRELDRCEG